MFVGNNQRQQSINLQPRLVFHYKEEINRNKQQFVFRQLF
jgi:hypothetical protein